MDSCKNKKLVNGRWSCMECGASWGAHETSLCQRTITAIPPIIRKEKKVEVARKPIAPELLDAAAETFRERNGIYGNNYQRFGAALLALFPDGGIPPITDVNDAQRLDYIIMCLGKLQRYAHNFSRGGHQDSARDLQVYAAMLEEFTDER